MIMLKEACMKKHTYLLGLCATMCASSLHPMEFAKIPSDVRKEIWEYMAPDFTECAKLALVCKLFNEHTVEYMNETLCNVPKDIMKAVLKASRNEEEVKKLRKLIKEAKFDINCKCMKNKTLTLVEYFDQKESLDEKTESFDERMAKKRISMFLSTHFGASRRDVPVIPRQTFREINRPYWEPHFQSAPPERVTLFRQPNNSEAGTKNTCW